MKDPVYRGNKFDVVRCGWCIKYYTVAHTGPDRPLRCQKCRRIGKLQRMRDRLGAMGPFTQRRAKRIAVELQKAERDTWKTKAKGTNDGRG